VPLRHAWAAFAPRTGSSCHPGCRVPAETPPRRSALDLLRRVGRVGVAQEVPEEVPVVGVHDGLGQVREVKEASRLRAQPHGPPAQARPRTQREGCGLPPIGRSSRWRRRPTRSTRLAQPNSIRTLNGARSPLRRHPRRRSIRQSRSLEGPGVGESALVEFASSLVPPSARRPTAHQPTRGALEQVAGQHRLGL
jgi:hypothetical protein